MLGTKKKSTVDIREAHNSWDILNSKYQIMEKILIYEGFVHDPDLKGVFKLIRKPINKNISILGKELMKYSVPAPDPNRAAIQVTSQTDLVNDEYIAMDVFLYFQEHVENLLSAFYSTATNDALRKIFKEMASKTITETNALVHYLRNKGWMEKPPMSKDSLTDGTKPLSLVEAAGLFDHLTYRYDTMYLTTIFATIVHDTDFKLVLDMGVDRLNKQVVMLEKRLKTYHVPFPKRPGTFTLSPKNIDFFDDDTIFRTLNSFMQGAGNKHAQAFKQATYNDDIRGFFKDLLIEEMDVYDKFVKLGKVKGWLNPIPSYIP